MHYYNQSKWKKKLDPGLFVQTQLYGYLSFKWNTCCFLPVSFWTFLLFFLQKFFVGASKHSIAPLSHLLNSSVKAASFQLRINGQKFVLTYYKPLSGKNKQILISTKIQFNLAYFQKLYSLAKLFLGFSQQTLNNECIYIWNN